MISLRYHLISLAAVFLSLAVGIVLGSTTLSGSVLSAFSDEQDELAEQVSELSTERNGLNARLAGAEGFAVAVGPLAVRGQLDQRTVVLVTTADARPADRDALQVLVAAAGGTVTGELQLTEAFTDPAKTDQLREVVTRLVPAGVRLPTAADPGTLAGGLIGPLVLTNSGNQPQASGEATLAALAGLADGGFVRWTEGLRPAQLAIVLSGGSARGHGAGDQAATIARFAAQLDRSGAGTVLAGGPGSADGAGGIGVVRADTAATSILSTVDNVDTGAGRVGTVLALREQLEGRSGQYGTAGNAKAVLPAEAAGR